MADYVDNVIRDLLKGFHEPPTQGTYTPSLVIGLGGAGLKTLRTLKKCLLNYSTQTVKLMGIDSDDGENRKFPELPPLDSNELCIFNENMAIRTLAFADEKSPDHRYIDEFLPNEHEDFTGVRQMVRNKIQSRKGAGQFRRAGKLLFGANTNNALNLNSKFREARQELIGLSTRLQKDIAGIEVDPGMKIFVVTSAAGGTGAGTLLECLALLRSHFDDATDTITVFMLLPGPTLDNELTDPSKEIQNTRGNAIGLIRELQAFMLAEINHTFEFDKDSKFRYDGLNPLLNDCYLIDNTLIDRTPVDSWMDMCQAVGYFLYSLLGTGIGAARDSGAINGQINRDTGREAIPRLFNTLGIGVVEYPIEDLAHFGIQKALDVLLTQWLKPKFEAKKSLEKVTEIMSLLDMGDIESVRSKLNFFSDALPESRFLPGEQDKKLALKTPDAQFIGFGDTKMREIDGELNAYNETLEQQTIDIAQKAVRVLDEQARLLITGNHNLAKDTFAKLGAEFEKLRKELHKDQEKRKTSFANLKNEMEQLKKSINFWDFYLDRKPRKTFINRVNQFLRHRVDFKTDSFVSRILADVLKKINDLGSTIKNTSIELENIQESIEKQLANIAVRDTRLGFIQSAMPFNKFEKWCKEINLPLRQNFVTSSLDEEVILREALIDAGPQLVRELSDLDLINDANRDADILKRLQSFDISSQPFMHLIKTAPMEQDMIPQKFVAGNVENDGDPFVEKNYETVGRGRVIPIPTGNKQMVICSRTLHGFGLAHWSEYERALKCYKEKPWYFHSLPASIKLPPLEVVSNERLKLMQTIGIGFMAEFIISKGSNYYRNMTQWESDKAYYYLTFKKDPSHFAQQLSANELIKTAKQSQIRPQNDNKIANSLESLLDTLAGVQWASFVAQVDNILEDYIAIAGSVEAKKQVKAYVKNVLVEDIKKIKSSTPRRELLNDISDALLKYADDIC